MEKEKISRDSPGQVFGRASNILLGVAGILGVFIPFTTNENVKDALKISVLGIGMVQTLYTVLSKIDR